MLYIEWILGAAAVIYFIAYGVLSLVSGRGVRHLFFTVFSGFFALVLAVVFKNFAGFSLEFNIYTLAVSCFWGIPGVIMLITVGFIFL